MMQLLSVSLEAILDPFLFELCVISQDICLFGAVFSRVERNSAYVFWFPFTTLCDKKKKIGPRMCPCVCCPNTDQYSMAFVVRVTKVFGHGNVGNDQPRNDQIPDTSPVVY